MTENVFAKKKTYIEVSCQHMDPNDESQMYLRCLGKEFETQRYQDDGFETATSIEQVNNNDI